MWLRWKSRPGESQPLQGQQKPAWGAEWMPKLWGHSGTTKLPSGAGCGALAARGVGGPEAGARGQPAGPRGPARPGWGRSGRSRAEKGWGAGHAAYLLHAALVLLRHGQQHAVEALLLLLPAHRAALRALHSRSAMPALRTVRVGPNGPPGRPSAAEPETRTAPASRVRPSLLSSRLPAHRWPLRSRNAARFTGHWLTGGANQQSRPQSGGRDLRPQSLA